MKRYMLLLGLLFSQIGFALSLTELEAILQTPKNIQGEFKQEKYLKTIKQPISSQGRFILLPKQGLLWHLQQPFDNKIRITPKGIEQYMPNNDKWVGNKKQMSQNTQISLFLNLLGGDSADLSKNFSIAVKGNEQQWVMELTPTSTIMQQIFSKIELSGANVVQQIELFEKQGDRTLITFINNRINQIISVDDEQALQH